MAPIEYEPSRSNTGVHAFPLFTVRQTPPEADATKSCDALFGSTAKPITRPDVNAGPSERNRKPLKVGVDMGSRGAAASSPAAWAGLFASGVGEPCGVAVGVGVAWA